MNRILIVEDDESIAQMMRLCLVKNKYICDLCYDGAQGARMVEENSYDLVLIGYDNINYYFNDPNSGKTIGYEKSLTNMRFREMGSQAVVITPKNEQQIN